MRKQARGTIVFAAALSLTAAACGSNESDLQAGTPTDSTSETEGASDSAGQASLGNDPTQQDPPTADATANDHGTDPDVDLLASVDAEGYGPLSHVSDADYTFDVPDGWSVTRANDVEDDEYNFLMSKGVEEDGFVLIMVGEPGNSSTGEPTPWNDTADVLVFLDAVWGTHDYVPITVDSYSGYFSSDVGAGDSAYELVMAPGVRLFVLDASADTADETQVEAIIGSVRFK